MYYFIPLCVAVLLHGTAALDGCNDTCSSILAVNGSGEFDVDCNSGVTAEYFKCISASTGCDDIAKSRIAEHSILQYYPAAWSKKRSFSNAQKTVRCMQISALKFSRQLAFERKKVLNHMTTFRVHQEGLLQVQF
ncbi:hypothetical protein EMCRGX_G016350 [Ephydatia muelleri]